MDLLPDFEASTSSPAHFRPHDKLPFGEMKESAESLGEYRDVDMGKEKEDIVQWQSSQTSSALASLLGKGSFCAATRPTFTSGSNWSPLSSASTSTSSSSTFNFDQSLTASESYSSNTSNESQSSVPSSSTLSRRRRGSALASSSRKSVSSASTSKGNDVDLTETFALLVKQVTTKVDENLAHNAGTSKPISLARTTSRSKLFGGSTNLPQKPVSAGSVIVPGRRPGQGRVLGRTLSANAVAGKDREHRVGGDMKGKGKLQDEALDGFQDSLAAGVGEEKLDQNISRLRGLAPSACQSKVPVQSKEVVARREMSVMPPPALPPERGFGRGQSKIGVPMVNATWTVYQEPISSATGSTGEPAVASETSSNSLTYEPPEAKPHPKHVLMERKTSSRDIEHPISPLAVPIAPEKEEEPLAIPKTVNASASVPNCKNNSSQYQRQQPISKPSQGVSRMPPPLGMRRAHTFNSSASQSAYSPFGFASQHPNGRYNAGNASVSGGGANARLPVRQKGFRPPLKATEQVKTPPAVQVPDTACRTSHFPPRQEAQTVVGRAASNVAGATSARVQAEQTDTMVKPGARQAPFIPPLTNNTISSSFSSSALPNSNSSSSSSSTLNFSSASKAPGNVGERDEFDAMLEDDPNDSSYGDIDLDMDALEDACRMYD